MSVKCNAMQPSSIVQVSTILSWLTKKKQLKKQSSFKAEFLQEALKVQDKFTVIFVFKKSSKIERYRIIGVETLWKFSFYWIRMLEGWDPWIQDPFLPPPPPPHYGPF